MCLKFSKLETPLSMEQGRGAARKGLKDTPEKDNVLWSLSSQGISAQAEINIMQQAVAKCTKVSICSKGVQNAIIAGLWQ